jgi:outer membrane protein
VIPVVVIQAPALAPVLTLAELLAQLEANYPKLIGGVAERDGASAKRLSKQGAFDPSVSASVESQRFNSSTTRGKAQSGSGTALELEGATEQGLKYRIGQVQNAGAVKSPGSSTGSAGTFFAEIKLPLLRGAGLNEKSVALNQARLGESVAQFSLTRLRQDVFLETAQAFVKWTATRRKAEVARKLLVVAEVRLTGIREEIRLRQRAPIEGTEAEAEVELRRERLASAERGVDEARLKLEKYVWTDLGLDRRAPEPLARPTSVTESDAKAAEVRALELRPELRLLNLESEAVRLDGDLARGDRRWQLDVVLAPGRDLGNNGIGSTLKAGIAASVPLYQRDARGREELARLKALKLAQEKDLALRTISLDVRDAVSAIDRAYERFLAAEANFRKTKDVEDGEITLFRAGASTLFLVNQRERATAESESRLIDSQLDHALARQALRAASMEF